MSVLAVRNRFIEMVTEVAPDIRITYEGESVELAGQKDRRHIRFTMMPTRSTLNTIGPNGVIQEGGLLSLQVWDGRSTGDINDILTVAQSLVDYFKPQYVESDDSQLEVRIAWMENVRYVPGGKCVPVFIDWINLTYPVFS